jgi:hypothetical protein
MGSLHSMNGSLLLSFYYRGVRRREYLQLRDTRDNRRSAQALLKNLEGALRRPDFHYAKWFPESKHLAKFVEPVKAVPTVSSYYARWLETLEISKASRYWCGTTNWPKVRLRLGEFMRASPIANRPGTPHASAAASTFASKSSSTIRCEK